MPEIVQLRDHLFHSTTLAQGPGEQNEPKWPVQFELSDLGPKKSPILVLISSILILITSILNLKRYSLWGYSTRFDVQDTYL